MKGYRFYQEFDRKKTLKDAKPTGNVIALPVSRVMGKVWLPSHFMSEGKICAECFHAVFSEPNSPVCFGAIASEYLHERCKRTSEQKAREIHPMLFVRLDE